MAVKTEKLLYDAIIIGGGPSGLTLSCLLGQQGLRVICLDQADPKKSSENDLRTTAISYGSRKILDQAGIWPLITEACPIDDIRILDGRSPLLLNFLSEEAGGKSFGWIVENMHLRAALTARLKALKTTEIQAPIRATDFRVEDDYAACILEDGSEIKARLLIGADGRGSFMRRWMGVDTRAWSYRQQAIVCTVAHEHPHNQAAIEHFWPSGPFAILPMSDDADGQHRSSVVFTEHGSSSRSLRARSLMALSDEAFEAALAERFPENYGDIKLISKRAAYPLGLIHAAHYTAPRMALIADAAHGIHPIAGQGLNLGFRDIAALSTLIEQALEAGEDIGGLDILQRYERARRIDNMSMIAFTDGLNRLFGNNIPPVRFLRRAGLRAVAHFPPARRFFMKRAMGDI
ncbi:MAG: UbiH/UbiF/VisC/COQ6 family ubiquinone biosynthesis hydroxylase [Alphaproteobacteria bacterium]|nr:UbiH/UbiF/VisC/COQ6 family ubiquinone biosynthesis hydroxylase [Alphaproteobacteria bacterium]